jgi:hypothetical protein
LCHSALAFDNKLWVMGGNDGNNLRNDVWYSTDGDSWVCATTSAPWTPRNTCVVALAGRMWILGGYDWSNRNDIWSSTDGVQWDLVTDSAGWRPRGSHASAVWAGSIWVLGGYADGPLGDVWHSYDGANWDVANDSAPWEPRMAHASLALEDRLWVLGGTGFFPDRSDVWCTDPLALEEPLTQARPVAGVCLDAFPNPFSAGVTIRLSGRAFARALVSINNAAGVEVRRLTGGAATPAGCRLRWDGRDDAGRTTPAGVYMLRLQAGGAEFSRKLVKLR